MYDHTNLYLKKHFHIPIFPNIENLGIYFVTKPLTFKYDIWKIILGKRKEGM